MPLAVTYPTLGTYAAAQIALLNAQNAAATQPLLAYLNHLAPIVVPHFPAGWLNGIRVRVVPVLPAPLMNTLSQDLQYANVGAFQARCNLVSPLLFNALNTFSAPLANIVAITYDDVVYLTPAVQNDLSTIIHEVVHTLQWSRFGPAGFLARYLQGFVANNLVYEVNPGEARAYHFEHQFTAAANAGGVNLTAVIYAQLRANPGAPLFAPMIATLTGLGPMGITQAAATVGM